MPTTTDVSANLRETIRGTVLVDGRRRVRGGEGGLECDDRPSTGRDRETGGHPRRRRGGARGTRPRPPDLRPRRRAQCRRPRGGGGIGDGRPLDDAPGRCRPCRPDRARRGWRHLGRRRSGDAGPRARHARGPDLGYRCRRAHAVGRHRLAAVGFRPLDRQPGGRRGRHRRRLDDRGHRRRAARGPVVGTAGRGRQLRGRDPVRPRTPPGRSDRRVLWPGLRPRGRSGADPLLARLPRRQARSRRLAGRVLDDPGGSRVPGERVGPARVHRRRDVRGRCSRKARQLLAPLRAPRHRS